MAELTEKFERQPHMSGVPTAQTEALRRRLEELRAQRARIELRHAELQRMLGQTANEYVRTGGALDELEYQLGLAGSKQETPGQAGGGED